MYTHGEYSPGNPKRADYQTADAAWYVNLKELAKKNRSNPTEAEKYLWNAIRAEFPHTKFRRQHIIGDFIVDLVSIRFRLIIEIDGEYHNVPEQQQYDEHRTIWLERNNFKVIRFTNEQVLYHIQDVLNEISNYIQEY